MMKRLMQVSRHTYNLWIRFDVILRSGLPVFVSHDSVVDLTQSLTEPAATTQNHYGLRLAGVPARQQLGRLGQLRARSILNKTIYLWIRPRKRNQILCPKHSTMLSSMSYL